MIKFLNVYFKYIHILYTIDKSMILSVEIEMKKKKKTGQKVTKLKSKINETKFMASYFVI